MNAVQHTDAELVGETLSGNRDAFSQIVARYQSLVCALAYSATGNLGQSEDLAQETFITAWKHLSHLRERDKLRSWLGGIARNRINNFLRREGREPIHQAEPLETASEARSPEALPVEHIISREEQAILWHTLERIPEIYREPLVLFYRENQSVERVAQALELSEDAVHQRLSRGRKLLQEQVLAFVEGALGRTNPGHVFTLAVLAALPALTISAKAATVGAAVKGGATATGAGLIGLLGAILTPLLAFFGMWTDYRMKKKAGHSTRELKPLKIYYIGIAVSVVVVILACITVMSYGDSLVKTSPSLFASLIIGLILGYFIVIGIFARWFIRATKKLAVEQTLAETAAKPKSPVWEYRSRFELLGLPFIHIRFGGWQGGQMNERLKARKPVKAWIAVTDACAIGVLFAYGASAIAPISIGACALGLFSYGGLAVGALAVGGFGFGIWAFGAFAFGWQASAGCAIAWNTASGAQYAIAHHYALGATAHAAQANTEFVRHLVKSNPFFQVCWKFVPHFIWLMWLWAIPITISMIVQRRVIARKNKQKSNQEI